MELLEQQERFPQLLLWFFIALKAERSFVYRKQGLPHLQAVLPSTAIKVRALRVQTLKLLPGWDRFTQPMVV
jgi:hypothetical protein